MRHNKIMDWEDFLGVVDQIQKISPWLSRQIRNRGAELPFWICGAQVREWNERQVWVYMPPGLRNSVDGEICNGHLLLAAELSFRLLLMRARQEFPFRYRLKASRLETHHLVDRSVDFKFALDFEEWERIRLDLAKNSVHESEFAFSASLEDGRLAASFAFQVAFELEKFLRA